MGQIFDILTIAVIVAGVVLLVTVAIHSAVILVKMTINRKSPKKEVVRTGTTGSKPLDQKHPKWGKEVSDMDALCMIYKKKYLNCKPLSKRARVHIELDNLNLIKQLLVVIEPKASISGYINNIVSEHLEKCKPEIIKLYKEKRSTHGS